MSRPVSYACDPGQRYCECGHCALSQARNIDLDAVANLNRATTATATFFILVAFVLAIYAVGASKTEQVHREIVKARSV